MLNGDGFVVTYPCYIPLGIGGEGLLTVSVDGRAAIVYLSDEDLLSRFLQRIFPKQGRVKFGAIKCSDRSALLSALQMLQTAREESGVEHIVLDPPAGTNCTYTTIREFVEHVERIPD